MPLSTRVRASASTVLSRNRLGALYGGARAGDAEAEQVLRMLYPGRDIRMLSITALAAGGGGIRCLTQPVPI
ncbi:agmatine deiminase family protein [Bradyrhizobium japonicum]|uniref:agmatine deiminase family protein n=1 Tax=Bradyrhizobium japonicum TaxID=375 RepID=UPI003B67C37D